VAGALEREPAKGGVTPAELESGAKALLENMHVLADEFAKVGYQGMGYQVMGIWV
jgi:hypothetical protein